MLAGIDLLAATPSDNMPWSLALELVLEVNSEMQNVLCNAFIGVKAVAFGKGGYNLAWAIIPLSKNDDGDAYVGGNG